MGPVDTQQAADQVAGSGGKAIHLKDYLRVLLARRWVLVSTFVLVVLATTVWVLVQTPIYRAEALLLLNPGKVNLTSFQDIGDPTMGTLGGEIGRREFYETQYKLIVARPILEKAFLEFKFGQRREFRDKKEPLKAFATLFDVTPVRRSRLVSVTFDWKDRELAARVLDFTVNQYIADSRSRSLGVTVGGLQALRLKAGELRPKVEVKANELQQFMVTHNMVSLEKTQNIVVDRLKEISRSLTEVERDRIKYESVCQTMKQAAGNRAPEDMPEIGGSNAIRDLKLEYIRAKQERSDLSERFGPNHLEVVAAKARMETIGKKLQEEITSVLAAAQAELDRATQQARDLKRELADQEKRVMGFNKLAVQYNILRNASESLQKTYEAIVKRIEEIEIAMAAGSKEDNVFVIAPPKPPVKPAKPRKGLSVALAAVVGLLLGTGLCFFFDYLDTTLKTKDDVESLLQAPVIGYVPAVTEDKPSNGQQAPALEMVAVARPRSAVAEAFRSIRTALSFSGGDDGSRHLLVTSSARSEGKTLVSINLAITMAQAGKKVLLVDADLRKPRIHKVFSLPTSPGLSNLLAGQGPRTLEEVIQPVAEVENLSFLACGPIPPNPAELLDGPRMQDLLKELDARFDMVIFDTPPVMDVTDPIALLRHVRSAILVVRCFATQRELARRTRETLAQAEGTTLGIVLNNVDVPRGSYYAYDSYYYYHYYYYDSDDKSKKRKRRRRRGSPSGQA